MEGGQNQLVGGRYRLLRHVGRGGMGDVWEAHDQKLERRVAVKVVGQRFAGNAEALVRFQREALAVAKLRSPHVVQVHDYGTDDDRPFIVMELLEGETLAQRLRREPQLRPELLQIVSAQLGKALATAHRAGIIHRDLKPENVFLVNDHHDVIVKVYDFGIAKALHGLAVPSVSLTQTGTLMGTPKYMSPEQLAGRDDVDLRTDLWSLAIILYRCCAGRYPFEGRSLPQLITSIVEHQPPAVDGLPPSVDQFFRRALAKQREARFADALLMTDEFTVALGSSSSMSRPAEMTRAVSSPSAPISEVADATTMPVMTSARPPRVRWIGLGAFLALALGAVGAYAVLGRPPRVFATGDGAHESLGAVGASTHLGVPSTPLVAPRPSASASASAAPKPPPPAPAASRAEPQRPTPASPQPSPHPSGGLFDKPW